MYIVIEAVASIKIFTVFPGYETWEIMQVFYYTQSHCLRPLYSRILDTL